MTVGRKAGVAAALTAAAVIGSAAAFAFARATSEEPRPRAAPSKPSSKPPSRVQRDNRYVLSHAESKRLVAWARKFRECAVQRGLRVGEPVAHAKQIDLPLETNKTPEELAPTTIGCGDSLGEPPRRSSLQFRPGKLVLYLPKQCLLDPKLRT